MIKVIIFLGAVLVGLATFGFIAKKYGSECTP